MKDANNVLGCPFCGNEAHVFINWISNYWNVECCNKFCHASRSNKSYSSEQKAIDSWNKRFNIDKQHEK